MSEKLLTFLGGINLMNKKTITFFALLALIGGQGRGGFRKIDDADHVFYATATVYNIDASQTDSTPLMCADGTTASYDKKIVAVSREQLKRWGGEIEYGDKLLVEGADKHDGIWYVHDTMNKRYGAHAPAYDNGVEGIVEPHSLKPTAVDGVTHIDFLVTDNLGKWENVKCTVVKN